MKKLIVTLIGMAIIKFCYVNGETIEEFLCVDQPPNTRLPHPEHCDVYLVCRRNTAIQIRCDSGVLFNPQTEECDSNFKDCPKDSGNNAVDDNDEEGEEVEEQEEEEEADEDDERVEEDDDEDIRAVDEVTTAKPNKPVLPGDKDDGVIDNNIGAITCPKSDTEQITFITHSEDCSIYYLCYHGKPIPFQCTLGMHWSNKQKKCVPRELSECAVNTNGILSGCPERGVKFMPHPNVCQYFVYCMNGAQTIQRCEPFYHWDVNERKCKLKTIATCYQNVKQVTKETKKNSKIIKKKN